LIDLFKLRAFRFSGHPRDIEAAVCELLAGLSRGADEGILSQIWDQLGNVGRHFDDHAPFVVLYKQTLSRHLRLLRLSILQICISRDYIGPRKDFFDRFNFGYLSRLLNYDGELLWVHCADGVIHMELLRAFQFALNQRTQLSVVFVHPALQ
jgi:hypothetical protein